MNQSNTIIKVRIKENLSPDKTQIRYALEWGRKAGMYKATGYFTYKKPANEIEKKHNYVTLLNVDKAREKKYNELNHGKLDFAALAEDKLDEDFIDYYDQFVKKNQSGTRRHLPCSLSAFKKFLGKESIPFKEITAELSKKFRDEYLLTKYNGETPSEYFDAYKKVLKQATVEKYFTINPTECLESIRNDSDEKEVLELDEWETLLKSPCPNNEVGRAAIFSLNTGLRWGDVSKIEWKSIQNGHLIYKQAKTKRNNNIRLTPDAIAAIGEIKTSGRIFPHLPTANGANKILKKWVKDAGIPKKITWHCLRHTISYQLLDSGTPDQTVAGLMGHKSTIQVRNRYNRMSHKTLGIGMDKLPSFIKIHEPETTPEPVVESKSTASDKLALIKELKELGFTPEEIKAELQKLS